MQTFCRLHSTLGCKAQCTKAAYLTLQQAFFQRKIIVLVSIFLNFEARKQLSQLPTSWTKNIC